MCILRFKCLWETKLLSNLKTEQNCIKFAGLHLEPNQAIMAFSYRGLLLSDEILLRTTLSKYLMRIVEGWCVSPCLLPFLSFQIVCTETWNTYLTRNMSVRSLIFIHNHYHDIVMLSNSVNQIIFFNSSSDPTERSQWWECSGKFFKQGNEGCKLQKKR